MTREMRKLSENEVRFLKGPISNYGITISLEIQSEWKRAYDGATYIKLHTLKQNFWKQNSNCKDGLFGKIILEAFND